MKTAAPLRWTRGAPPEKHGVFLVQFLNGDVAAALVRRERDDSNNPYWSILMDDDSIELNNADEIIQSIARHYGPAPFPRPLPSML